MAVMSSTLRLNFYPPTRFQIALLLNRRILNHYFKKDVLLIILLQSNMTLLVVVGTQNCFALKIVLLLRFQGINFCRRPSTVSSSKDSISDTRIKKGLKQQNKVRS